MTTIIKSPNDRRLFKYIKLSNNLEALLVSDPKTSKAAASLSVSIGSNHNGSIDGIAHFLEHMLFMGSQKYPDENCYGEYLKENGGSSNAYTSSDHTNYYFECVPEGLLNVLDIFAQFFISPLLKHDSVDRELLAVDSEFRNGLSSDPHIFSAARKQFMNPNYPSKGFTCGSIDTLKIPDIREKVAAFYKKYYSSHLMKLVVVGNEPLADLEDSVVSMFSLVPEKSILLNNEFGFQFTAPLYGEIVSIKDEHRLEMSWEYSLYDKKQMCRFLSHLIGHEGPGSLHELLNQRFLIKSLNAGPHKLSETHYKFSVSVQLTDNGFQNVDLVKQIILNYISMASQASFDKLKPLYDELKRTSEEKFKNYIVPKAGKFATSMTEFWSTNEVDPKELVAHPYMYDEYDLNMHLVVAFTLGNMRYDNSITFLSSKSFDMKEGIQVEKWYSAKYIKYPNIPKLDLNLSIPMTVPSENKYICSNQQKILPTVVTGFPILLPLDNMSLYWKQDTSFGTPDIQFLLSVTLPNKHSNIVDDVLGRLYMKCLHHILNAELYNINCANYNASVNKTGLGVGINVSGYPEKFMLVVKSVVEGMLNMKDGLTNDIFDNIKTVYEKELQNYKYQNPYQMITYELSTLVQNNTYIIKDLLATLSNITYDDLLRYELFTNSNNRNAKAAKAAKSVKVGNKLLGLVQGNITQNEALTLGQYISSRLGIGAVDTYNEYYFEEQLKTSLQNEFIKELENKDQVNSCYKLSVKIGYLRPETNDNYAQILAYLQVFNEIISEHYFDQLRTKEQLGYIVYSHNNNYGKNSYQLYSTYDFCVQSASKDTDYLRNRTMQFVKEFKEFLLNKSEESINSIILAQTLSLQKPFQNLSEASGNNFANMIAYGEFDIRDKKVRYMENITKKDLVEFYENYFRLDEGTFWSICLTTCSLTH